MPSAGTSRIEVLLKKALAADPDFGDAYLQLGILYSSEDKTEDAVGAYQRAIAVAPQLAEPHFRLGVIYKKQQEPETAKEEFQRFEKLQKADADAVERERMEIRQFLIVLDGPPPAAPKQ